MTPFKFVVVGLLFTILILGSSSQRRKSSGRRDFIQRYAYNWNSFLNKMSTLSGNEGFLAFKLAEEKTVNDPIPINNKFKIPPLSDVKTYVKFAAAAYCDGPKLTSWNCADCVALGHDVRFIEVYNNATMGTRAFFAVNENKKEIILSFRGTSNLRNILDDTKIDLVPIDGGGEEIKVHRGALEVLSSLYDQVLSTLRSLISKYAYRKVIITGHSLGGMVASLTLFKLKTDPEFQKLDCSLYTYAAPRSGNLAFAQWINAQSITGIRVVGGIDIVPHVLGLRGKGYVHHLRELWVHKTYPIVWKTMNQLCSGDVLEDPNCSVSIQDKPYLNLLQHVKYWDVFFPPLDCFQEWLRNFFI